MVQGQRNKRKRQRNHILKLCFMERNMSMKMRHIVYEFNVATQGFSFAAAFTPEVAVTAKAVKAIPTGGRCRAQP